MRPFSLHPRTGISRLPRRRGRERLDAAGELARWVELQDPHQAGVADEDGEDLFEIHYLVTADAPEARIGEAVRTALEDGWGWAAIEMALGERGARARRRGGTGF